jgi:hypothetical protein
VIESRKQVNLFLAGQGSGKTHIAGIMSAILITNFPKVHGFIGANTHMQLSDSTLFRIRTVWNEIFGWSEYSKENPRGIYVVDRKPPAHFDTKDHEYDHYYGKICFLNGTVIYKGSLDNYKAHDGKEFGWAILDETKDTKEEAVKEVITGRLREAGMFIDKDGNLVDKGVNEETKEVHTPWNPLYIFTSPAKVQWINEWFNLDDHVTEITQSIYSSETYFIKDAGNKRVVISSTFHNAHNLPSNYISNQKENLHSGLQDMLIYGNPFSNTGGEFYKYFNRSLSVRDVKLIDGFNSGDRAYNPDLPIHASFDFNVNPYMTCVLWQIVIDQIKKTKKAIQIDEICLPNPNNTTEAICKELVRKYQGHGAGWFVYGDTSGKKQDTRSEKGSNDYVIIMKSLSIFKPSLRLPINGKAPAVVMRKNFINTIFEKTFEGVEIIIHEKCSKSIDDYVYLKEASDGTKLKEKVKNPDTGVSYEKFGHTSDASDYFICMAFLHEYVKYQNGPAGKNKPSSNSSDNRVLANSSKNNY